MMPERQVYLHDIPMDQAWRRFVEALTRAGLWNRLGTEAVPLAEAVGRVTAEPVWAAVSAPHYHASAMDGYAVRSKDTLGAAETSPITLTVIEDDMELERVGRPAKAVNTGHALPSWADAVIMIENVQPSGREEEIVIRAAISPWKNIRQMGEDMVATELVLPASHTLRPVDLGAIAGSGHASVSVAKQPRVAILPTGSELVSADDAATGKIRRGQIIEYNSLVLGAQVELWGGIIRRWPIVKDDFESIAAAVRQAAAENDLVLINAGSSAGSEDYSVHVVEAMGEVLVHGIAVRPGHPVIFGMIHSGERQVPIIGVPGYPVSAAMTGELFVEPLLAKWLGRQPLQPPQIRGRVSRKVTSPTGDDDYMRVTVGKVGDQIIVTPLSRGAGVISSLVRADGIVHIPRFSEGLAAGTEVTVSLYRSPESIANTIVAMGSHDIILDLMAQFVAERSPWNRLVSANVGSLGGLVALKRSEAHFGGSHLLDPETGQYNWRYIDQYLPGMDIVLVTLVSREQGLMLPAGNPQGITGLTDLTRDNITTVNRQRGAGTRVLFDYELNKLGISPDQVKGYDREEYTHLAVAAAVSSGTASCGMGVRAAARALDLDFVTVGWERYDLVMTRETYEGTLFRPIRDLLHDADFREAVMALPGYDVSEMGLEVLRG